jgi:lysophospholipase L1-like esterase
LITLLLYGTRHRAMTAKVWLALGSVGITYVLVDVVAGFILIRPLSPPLAPDEFRHHKLVPNTYSEFTQQDFHYIQRVNNLGLRGKDQQREKALGVYRILMLGDSFTMGKGVNDDQTFSALLETMLNRDLRGCGPLRVEVLNGGVDSYSPILSYIQLSRDLYVLGPDIVVFNLDVSDLVQESIYRELARFDGNGQPVAVPQPDSQDVSLNERVRTWTERHLYLTRLLLFYVNRMFGYQGITAREVLTESNYELVAYTLRGDRVPRDRQWASLFDSILRMRSFAQAHDMDFVLTAYPWGHQVSDREWQPGRRGMIPDGAVASDASIERIEEFAHVNGIALANMFPVFRAVKSDGLLYFKHDMHWTPTGHEVMSRGLDDFLQPMIRARMCH